MIFAESTPIIYTLKKNVNFTDLVLIVIMAKLKKEMGT